jgi:hypothetical protein
MLIVTYAECHIPSMLSVIMLNVVMPSVVMRSVEAPMEQRIVHSFNQSL